MHSAEPFFAPSMHRPQAFCTPSMHSPASFRTLSMHSPESFCTLSMHSPESFCTLGMHSPESFYASGLPHLASHPMLPASVAPIPPPLHPPGAFCLPGFSGAPCPSVASAAPLPRGLGAFGLAGSSVVASPPRPPWASGFLHVVHAPPASLPYILKMHTVAAVYETEQIACDTFTLQGESPVSPGVSGSHRCFSRCRCFSLSH